MADPYTIARIAICLVGIFLNGIGLFLLLKLKSSKKDHTQRWIIINLCIIAFGSSAVNTISGFLDVLNFRSFQIEFVLGSTFRIGFYFATFWLVLDRYLHIKLNMKYVLHWSKKKTLVTTVMLYSLALLFGVAIIKSFRIFLISKFVYVGIDTVIIFFSAFVYTHALMLSRKQRNKIRSNQTRNRTFKGLLISTIILMSFITLAAVPDIIVVVLYNAHLSDFNSIAMARIINVAYNLSFCTDAPIYIFVSPQVRNLIKRNSQRYQGSSNSFQSSKTDTINWFISLEGSLN